MYAIDLTSQSESSIKNMIDIKTQLHDEKNKIGDATEECKEKIE